jgi:multidrug efflux pump subunit AcrA (membrane-fusion protein)
MLLRSAFAVSLIGASAFARPHAGAPPPAPVVFAKAIQASEVFDSIIYPAKLISRVNATLLAESEGVVQEIKKPLGTRVKVGEPVFTLTNPDPVYTYAPFAVLSPVAGIVSQVAITQGSRVSKGQRLGSITDPAQVHAYIEVTVSDLAAIHTGMKGLLELHDVREPVDITVAGISPLIDPATGTATAELKIVDKRKTPPPGLVGRVRFRARLHKGFELPESAVFYRGEQPLVRVMNGDKAVFRTVRLGNARHGKFEILEGLKSGDTVVLRSNTFIGDGEAVTVQPPEKEGT